MIGIPQPFTGVANDKRIKMHRVALVVLDIWMPGMTGLEVQERLSSMCCQTRVIIMTGSKSPDDERTAVQAGAVAFFKKPFGDEQFLSAVRDALNLERDRNAAADV